MGAKGSAGPVFVAEDRDRYYYGVNDIFRPQYSNELNVSMRRDQERCILVALAKNRPKCAYLLWNQQQDQ